MFKNTKFIKELQTSYNEGLNFFNANYNKDALTVECFETGLKDTFNSSKEEGINFLEHLFVAEDVDDDTDSRHIHNQFTLLSLIQSGEYILSEGSKNDLANKADEWLHLQDQIKFFNFKGEEELVAILTAKLQKVEVEMRNIKKRLDDLVNVYQTTKHLMNLL